MCNFFQGMGGITATQELRRLEVLACDRHMPVIAVSANAEPDDRKRYLAAGTLHVR
jgi:CheY-like chemotaxis protein